VSKQNPSKSTTLKKVSRDGKIEFPLALRSSVSSYSQVLLSAEIRHQLMALLMPGLSLKKLGKIHLKRNGLRGVREG
jgi:hypothetical protein